VLSNIQDNGSNSEKRLLVGFSLFRFSADPRKTGENNEQHTGHVTSGLAYFSAL